jgi:hypothetical protein
MGTEGARQAREYIHHELAALDLEVVEQRFRVEGAWREEPIQLVNVAARLPGRSSDIFLLVAPYDTRQVQSFRFLGVNDGGSGAAALLEMARVLSADPLPYTTWVVFLDGEAPGPEGGAAARPSHYGSRALAQRLSADSALAQLRLAVILNRVCDADLKVARDLLSHRIYREEFWRAAVRLGRTDAFPPGASFESPAASHHALSAVGLRRVVALVDTAFGGDEPPGLYAGTEDDDLEHCSAESLDAVGRVSLEALGTISQRLAKIDRFADSPLEESQPLVLDDLSTPETEAPEPEGAEPAPEKDEAAAEEPATEAP